MNIHSNVNLPEFRQMIKNIKTDQKDNLIALDPTTGDIDIFTFDQMTPELKKNIKADIPSQSIFFEDIGDDDSWASSESIKMFGTQIYLAGNQVDPEPYYLNLQNQIQDLKRDLNVEVGIQNVTYYLEQQLDNFSESLQNSDHSTIKAQAQHLLNITKQLYFGRVWVPQDMTTHRLNRPPLQLAAKFGEIAKMAQYTATLFQPGE